MELLWKDDKWNYEITIEGKDIHGNFVAKVYKTIDIISDMSSNLRGRATRAYEAYDVENPGSRVVIKDSWVNVNRLKEGDTLSEILDEASDEDKAMFLTALVHGIVTIDGREDLTHDLLMNGYMVSTDSRAYSSDNRVNVNDEIDDAIRKKLAKVRIADYNSVEDTAKGDHIHKASIFEILGPSKPGSWPPTMVTSPDVSTSRKGNQPLHVYGPKAHYRIVFKERGQSLHSLSRGHQINVPLVVKAMHDILKGSMILSDGAIEPF